MDPDPNPLLLPTIPEEVEIIGNQPLSLEEAIELSYRNNPDLQVALLELEQSRAALREAQARNYPTVAVDGRVQAQNTTGGGGSALVPDGSGGFTLEGNTSEELGISVSAQIDVAYNIYSSGQREASIQAAEEQVRLQELEVERRQEELRLNTVNEYYDLQAAVEAIRISEAFLEQAERNLQDTSLREEVGVGTRFDVLRAEVQVANARQDLVNSERARQVAQRTLARRLNVPPSLTVSTLPVDIAGSWPLSLEETIVLAFQNRAELEQQLVQRDLNEQLRIAELAALGPQVDLFANYSLSDILTQEDGFNDNYQFGARVSWTLYDGGAARARADQREINGEIASQNFEEARNTVRLSVESAYYNLQSNLTNIDTANFAVQQAREALRLAELRFEAGVGTQLDILNAQSELTDAEVNRVQAIVGYNRSLAELQRAVSNLPESYYRYLSY
jgi:outer membrane protein TolC